MSTPLRGPIPRLPKGFARRLHACAVLLPLALACTWVPLTAEGEQVRLVSREQTGSCQRLGETTSKVPDRVLIFARNERKMREELATLARNEAAVMAGDTVAAETPPRDGRQTFGVYRCRGA